MTRMLAALTCFLGLTGSGLAIESDAQMDRYFSIWADNARINPATVSSLYASHVVYYGHPMTPSQVYRDKLNYIRRWPDRRYGVVPGSVSKHCDAAQSVCTINAVLNWAKTDPSTGQASQGSNTVAMTLVREGGSLKIARESGVPIAQSNCRSVGGQLRCSAYR